MRLLKLLTNLPGLKRISRSFIRKLLIFINKEVFDINFRGIILETNIKDPLDRDIFFDQKYEEQQFTELFVILDNNKFDFFFDVGANSGIYSLKVSKKYKNLKIQAFEPISKTFEKFIRNIKKNNLEKNIEVNNFGLSNKNEKLHITTGVKFGYSQSAGYSLSNIWKPDDATASEMAYFKKLDDVFDHKNKKIYIKIDIEGHEIFALEGMKKLISNNDIFLQVEVWDKNFNSFMKAIKNKGFVFNKKIGSDYFFKLNSLIL